MENAAEIQGQATASGQNGNRSKRVTGFSGDPFVAFTDAYDSVMCIRESYNLLSTYVAVLIH